MKAKVSGHAVQRLEERLGVPSTESLKQFQMALERGKDWEDFGQNNKYKKLLEKYIDKEKGLGVKVFKDSIYLYQTQNNKLITVMPLEFADHDKIKKPRKESKPKFDKNHNQDWKRRRSSKLKEVKYGNVGPSLAQILKVTSKPIPQNKPETYSHNPENEKQVSRGILDSGPTECSKPWSVSDLIDLSSLDNHEFAALLSRDTEYRKIKSIVILEKKLKEKKKILLMMGYETAEKRGNIKGGILFVKAEVLILERLIQEYTEKNQKDCPQCGEKTLKTTLNSEGTQVCRACYREEKLHSKLKNELKENVEIQDLMPKLVGYRIICPKCSSSAHHSVESLGGELSSDSTYTCTCGNKEVIVKALYETSPVKMTFK